MPAVTKRVKKVDAVRLAAIRDGAQRGLTQGQVGEILGISKQAVSVWLKGKKIKWKELQVPLNQFPLAVGVKSQSTQKKGKLKPKQAGIMGSNDNSKLESQAHEELSLDRHKEISEELYAEMLLAAAKKDPSNLRIIAEVRNYLDTTMKFKTEKGDLTVDVEAARAIEMKARALLKRMEIEVD